MYYIMHNCLAMCQVLHNHCIIIIAAYHIVNYSVISNPVNNQSARDNVTCHYEAQCRKASRNTRSLKLPMIGQKVFLTVLRPEHGARERCRSVVFFQTSWITICWKVIMTYLLDDTKNKLRTPALVICSRSNGRTTDVPVPRRETHTFSPVNFKLYCTRKCEAVMLLELQCRSNSFCLFANSIQNCDHFHFSCQWTCLFLPFSSILVFVILRG